MKPCPNEKDLYPEHTPAGKTPPSKSAVDTARAILKKMSYAMPASRSRETQQMNHHRQPRPYRQHKRYNENRYNNNNFRRKQRRQEWQEIERVGGELQYVKGRVVDLVENVTKYVDNLRDHVAEQFSLRPIWPSVAEPLYFFGSGSGSGSDPSKNFTAPAPAPAPGSGSGSGSFSKAN